MGNGSVEITTVGERVILMPHRTVFWPARSTLLLADLHLGKGETLAAQGIPMPRGVVESDLNRLSSAVRETGATRVMVLGDLLHASIGIVPAMVEQVAAWRRTIPADVCLVPGNHDRRIERVAEEWGLHLCDDIVQEGPFVFVHDASHAPSDGGGGYVWSGHVHPRVRLKGGGDSISLPCFLVGDDSALLPAFSLFTSGVSVLPSPSERVWGVAEEALVEVPHLRRRDRASLP
jgi:uncharacterized protein